MKKTHDFPRKTSSWLEKDRLMQTDVSVPNPKELFAKVGTFFRFQREELANVYVMDLLAFLVSCLIRRFGRWPNRGEILTETARFHAVVQRFDRQARDAFNAAFAEVRAPFLREFWGARRALVPAELLPLWEPVAQATPADVAAFYRPFVIGAVDSKLRDALLMRDDEASKDLWRAAEQADRDVFDPRKLAAFTRALQDLLAQTTDLPVPVRADIEADMPRSEHAMTVALRAAGQWSDACNRLFLLKEFGTAASTYHLLPEGGTHRSDHDRYVALMKAFVEDPEADLRLATAVEQEAERVVFNGMAWQEGRPADGTSDHDGGRALLLMRPGTINVLRDAWDADVLLPLFDAIGTDLSAPAVRTVSRTGPLQGRPATWYAYPAGEDTTLLVALHLQPRDLTFDAAFLVRGDVPAALAWLGEHYSPLAWKEDFRALDDAPADLPRSVIAALQAEDAVSAVRARQAEAQEFLAAIP